MLIALLKYVNIFFKIKCLNLKLILLFENQTKKEENLMLNVYLSGEIHTNWRDEIIDLCNKEKLNIEFSSPTTNHENSDNCGVEILGNEETNF